MSHAHFHFGGVKFSSPVRPRRIRKSRVPSAATRATAAPDPDNLVAAADPDNWAADPGPDRRNAHWRSGHPHAARSPSSPDYWVALHSDRRLANPDHPKPRRPLAGSVGTASR